MTTHVGPGTLLGRYRLRALLATGGMAEVWTANVEGPAGFARTVVIKRVLPYLARDDEFVAMFLAEARLSAMLDHPNIVKVYELGQAGSEFFLAMEYVRGADLAQLVSQGVRSNIGMSAAIIQGVGRALGYAHALTDESGVWLRLVHRDVSPSNVMIGRDGTIRLFDFGIAKALAIPSGRRTETGTLKGKRGYMAPEQLRGGELDHRVDLFAAGVMLHELLTGQRLFKGANDLETLDMILSRDVVPPSALCPEVPTELDAICLRALARDPRQRFSSGDELADALAPYANGWDATRIQRALAPHFVALDQAAADRQALATETAPVVAAAETLVKAQPRNVRRQRWRIPVGWTVVACCAGSAAWFAAHREPPSATRQASPASPPPVPRAGSDTIVPSPIATPTAIADIVPPPGVAKESRRGLSSSPPKATRTAKRAPVPAPSSPVAAPEPAQPTSVPHPPTPTSAQPIEAFDPESARAPR